MYVAPPMRIMQWHVCYGGGLSIIIIITRENMVGLEPRLLLEHVLIYISEVYTYIHTVYTQYVNYIHNSHLRQFISHKITCWTFCKCIEMYVAYAHHTYYMCVSPCTHTTLQHTKAYTEYTKAQRTG